MKRLCLAALAAVALFATPALGAGVPIEQVPSRGSICYLQQPDGTFSPCKGDASGNLGGAGTVAGEVQFTVSDTAVGFTIPTGATYCYFIAETAAIRWRDDGTDPAAGVGYPEVSGKDWISSGPLSTLKFIRQTADTLVDGACYK